jgi:hypothetical protein
VGALDRRPEGFGIGVRSGRSRHGGLFQAYGTERDLATRLAARELGSFDVAEPRACQTGSIRAATHWQIPQETWVSAAGSRLAQRIAQSLQLT